MEGETACPAVITVPLFNPEVLTIVWARRLAGHKRPDLITRDIRLFRSLINSNDKPVQVIWAGKPFPFDFGAIETFNHLVQITRTTRTWRTRSSG